MKQGWKSIEPVWGAAVERNQYQQARYSLDDLLLFWRER